MSQDPEARHAEELEALLRELQAGHLPSTPDHAPEADAAFVAALVQLSHEIEPDSDFAAELEERLLARTPAATAGSPGRRLYRRAPAPPGRPHAWRRWMSLAAMVLLAVLLLTPQVRAGVGSVIRIGAVRIGLAPTGSAAPTPTPPYSGPVPTPLPSDR